MNFKEKYISAAEKLIDKESKKIELSNDAYAIGEMLEQVMIQLFRGNKHGR